MLSVVFTMGCGDESGPTVADRMTGVQAPAQGHAASSATNNGAKKNAGPAVAFVNGQPIAQRELVRTLIEGRGLGLLQQMMLREAARQEAERLGLKITKLDIEHEYDIAVRGERFNGKDVEALTPARREKMIDDWTQSRGVPRAELAIAMERNAYLRKIVADSVTITEAMLRREYERVHGERVEVRHIQLAAKRVYPQIQRRLERGDRFEDLVADYSQNVLTRINQGRMPPFSANDSTVPAVFAKVAFSLEPGQVSNPVEAEGSFHVLKLERRIPADQATFDDCRDKLRTGLLARRIAERMEAHARNLMMSAKIRIEDRRLRRQYRKRQASGLIDGPTLIRQAPVK